MTSFRHKRFGWIILQSIPPVPRDGFVRKFCPLRAPKHNFTHQLFSHKPGITRWTFIFFIIVLPTLYSQSVQFNGQWTSWIGVSKQEAMSQLFGMRYIPRFEWQKNFIPAGSIDIEASANLFWTEQWHGGSQVARERTGKPYRLWVRYQTDQWELRAGLQKINFGSAAMLRPLMWFDRIDPRDPLQMTDGIWGVLGRYFFTNNANIWLWGLIGNDKTKGWEVLGSDRESPELGGRFQMPVPAGEMALTLHQRQASLGFAPENFEPIDEYRFGLDGKWDIGPGLWVEAVWMFQDLPIDWLPDHRHLITLGADYTLGLGNGLHVLGEHFYLEASNEAFQSGQRARFSAMSMSYPLGLLDQVSVMVYYDWDNKEPYRFLSLQRLYDQWSLFLMGFWNPDRFNLPQMSQEHTFFLGKGLQFMIVFNH